jgi:hypothetical protein
MSEEAASEQAARNTIKNSHQTKTQLSKAILLQRKIESQQAQVLITKL